MQHRVVRCALWALIVVSCAFALRASAAPAEKASSSRTVFQYACGQWIPEEPKPAQALFDVLFFRSGSDADDGPSQAQLDAITNLGGKIVHEYNVQMVRARLRIDTVGSLQASFVRSAKKPHEHTVDALIGMNVPLSDEDRDFLQDVGAIVLAEDGSVVNALVPDEAIPAIRARGGVRFLEANRLRCPQVDAPDARRYSPGI